MEWNGTNMTWDTTGSLLSNFSISLGHSAKNWNLAFSEFFWEMSILRSQEVIAKIRSIAKIGLQIGPNPN
jgi:hypothetical protein